MMGCAEVCKYIQAGRGAYRSPRTKDVIGLGVDRLLAWPIIGADIKHFTDIGHFQNRFADNFVFCLFFTTQTNILFTGDNIYW